MTDAIEIKRDWDKVKRPKITRFLTKRYFGLWPSIAIWSVALAVLVAGMQIVDHLLPYRYQQHNWLAAMAPMYFAFLAMTILNGIWRKCLFRKISQAPIRRKNRSVFLSEYGVSDFGPPRKNELTWDYITEVVPYKNLILLLLSPVEYIPLELDGLPDGMTRESLLEQIEKWRKASTLDNLG
ncbi:hypothetical protein [Profundibacter sp.]